MANRNREEGSEERLQRWNQQDLGGQDKERLKDNTKFEGLSERMLAPLAEAEEKLMGQIWIDECA